jgi:hypothetical protein
MHLYEALSGLVLQWQNQHYPCERYPAIKVRKRPGK